jgi:hypothetical protein
MNPLPLTLLAAVMATGGAGPAGPVTGSPAAVPLVVAVELPKPAPGAAEETVPVRVTALRRGQGGEEAQVAEVKAPGRATFRVPAGAVVEVAVAAAGYWAPPRTVLAGAEAGPVRFSLRPTGVLQAAVTTALGAPLPAALTVRFRDAPGKPRFEKGLLQEVERPEHSLECPLAEGRLRCEVPAGSLDLRLRHRGFVTHFRWGLAVPAHGTAELGRLVLRPGATVFGWVSGEGEGFRPEAVQLKLQPATVADTSLSLRERAPDLALRAPASERGFFDFSGVAPGSYVLVATHEGFAPARMDPIVVREGVELELPPLILQPPVSLTLRVEPPTDPFRKPWQVQLGRRTGTAIGSLETATEGPVDPEGLLRASGLEPGGHRLEVRTSQGAVFHSETLEITGPEGVHEVRLAYDRLEARVTLAGEPVAAWVYFGGRDRTPRVVAETDEEGKVYVFLPRRERWVADVESPRLHLTARVEDIRVEKNPGEPWAKAEIELPDTWIQGQVVDEEGRPLERATVDVAVGRWQESQTARVFTEAKGRFELRGLPAGEWSLEASHRPDPREPSLSAPLTTVRVEDDGQPVPVRLVARREEELSGVVVAPNGDGVPGTLVAPALEQFGQPVSNEVQYKVTEVDGTFRFRIPHGVAAVQLQVYPPGYAARHFRVELPQRGPLIVPVDPVGGALVLVPEDPAALDDWSFHLKTAVFGQYLFYTPMLRQWAGTWGIREERNRLVLPNLEPGDYTVCYDVAELAFATGLLPAGVGHRCARATVVPGSERVLRVPVPRPAAEAAAHDPAPPPSR